MAHSTAERVKRDLAEVEDSAQAIEEDVVFRARGSNFRAIRVPRRRWVENGEIQTSEGIDYDFSPNGEFRTRDAGVVEYLRKLPSFDREFWQVGAEPGAVPSPEIVFEQIIAAATELDDERLAEIEREEQKGHKRELVLKAVKAARSRVQEGVNAPAPAEEGAAS